MTGFNLVQVLTYNWPKKTVLYNNIPPVHSHKPTCYYQEVCSLSPSPFTSLYFSKKSIRVLGIYFVYSLHSFPSPSGVFLSYTSRQDNRTKLCECKTVNVINFFVLQFLTLWYVNFHYVFSWPEEFSVKLVHVYCVCVYIHFCKITVMVCFT